MSKEEKNVPELRFKGFSYAWEQRKLENISHYGKGKLYSKKDLTNEGEQIVLYGQMYTDFHSEIKFSNTFTESKVNSIYSKGNEVIIPASGESAKDISIASAITSPNIIIGSDLNIIYPENFIHNIFLALTISHGNTKKQLSKFAQGKTIVHLHSSNFKKLPIYFPSLDEQVKISNLIATIEKLVTLHQRKINILKKLKQEYLSLMFPNRDKIIPELRFKLFKEAWEQRTLNSVYKVIMGHSPKSENYTSNPEDYVLVQGNADLINGWVSPRVWTTQITSLIEAGSILISVRAPVGNVGKTDYDVVIGRGIAAFEGNEFLYQTLKKMHIEGYWRRVSTGSTFESINSKDIKDALINLPTQREREKIGRFLEILDSSIILHQNKMSKLKKIKRTYLHKMFL